MHQKNQIVIYSASDTPNLQMDVLLEDETVWLTQAQMVELFDSTKQNISLHINNVYNEKELIPKTTVKEYLTVQIEGKRSVKRNINYYNLDVIISVGYRVKSIRGTQFRIWANKILKEYLLKGYVLTQRIDTIERKLIEHDQKFDLLIKTNLPPKEGIFFKGQIFDAYSFATDVIRTAKESLILIDNYIDESTLMILTKRAQKIKCTIYTAKLSKQQKLDLQKHNQQYPKIDVKLYRKAHDRFLIIDNKTIYHIGASIKDLGKKLFAFSKLNIDIAGMLKELNS